MTRVRIFASDRPTGLGASEVASVAGLNPWTTPLDIALRKWEGYDPEPNEYQRWGLELEGFLVKQAIHRLGQRDPDPTHLHHMPNVKRNSMTWSHPDWPVVRMFATPDGIADGGRTLVEAKVVNSRYSDWSDNAIPVYYELQGQVQLACYPDAERVLFVALIGGRLEYRVLGRPEPAVLDDLVENAMRWWANYIVREVVPPPVTDADRWTIVRRSVKGERAVRIATADEEAAAADLLALRERIGELESEAEATRLRLAELAADSDIGGNGFAATWSHRVTRDWRAAWAERTGNEPIPDEHLSTAPVFTVRARKEKE